MFSLINELFLISNPKKGMFMPSINSFMSLTFLPQNSKGKYKAKELSPFLDILKKFMAAKTQLIIADKSPQAKDIGMMPNYHHDRGL